MKSSCCHSQLIQVENNRSICLNSNCENYLAPIPSTYSPRIWNNVFALFFFTFIFLFTFNDYSFDKKVISNPAEALLEIEQNESITEDNLKLELKKQDVICREEVFAQLQVESGHMTSFLFKRTNNLCGMRFPYRRATAAIGIFLPQSDTIILGTQKELKKYSQQNNYAVYACWQDCVKDYKLWQDGCFKVKEKYLAFLGTNYAEDTQYVKKIQDTKR